MSSAEFQIELKGPGLEMVQQVPKVVAYRIARILLEAPDAAKSSDELRHDVERRLKMDFRRLRPRTNAERIGLVVYRVHRSTDRAVRRDDIPDWLVSAGESVPSNFSRDLSVAVEKKLVRPAEGGDDEAYLPGPSAPTLTRSGRRAALSETHASFKKAL